VWLISHAMAHVCAGSVASFRRTPVNCSLFLAYRKTGRRDVSLFIFPIDRLVLRSGVQMTTSGATVLGHKPTVLGHKP
jgi:hypothetical protein